jgi:hypothetical protein
MYTRDIYRIIVVSLLLVVPLLIWFLPQAVGATLQLVWLVAPLWLPVTLFFILIPLWLVYVQSKYVASIPHTTLELKPGGETPRTARAMELFFYSLYHRTETSRMMMMVNGHVRIPWAFEISAHNGVVRFFMRIPTAQRSAVEARLRAEYRDIDIDEVYDYARAMPFNPMTTRLESREFTFTKPDPYPLQTYEQYENKKNAKSPLLQLLEQLVAIGEHEHLFISFMIRPHQRERKTPWSEPVDTLHEDAQREIASIVGGEGTLSGLPENKRDLVQAIESALKKPSFDCGIRALYIAERSYVNEQSVFLLDNLFAVFEAPNRNGFSAYDARESLSWPLSDVANAIPGFADWYMLHLYRRRAFFAPPYFGRPFILNTAELATLIHMPYITRSSPLARTQGTRLEPPDNLPIVS